MSAQTALPDDHPLMKAWSSYKATEAFNNTLYWATTTKVIRQATAEEHGVPAGHNVATQEQRENYVTGSLWAAFASGYDAALAAMGVGR